MATKPPDDWPYRMALHMAQTRPVSTPEPVPCPKCDDETEPLWPPEDGEPDPPRVCPTCISLIEDE
jgi:hypothetical protein